MTGRGRLMRNPAWLLIILVLTFLTSCSPVVKTDPKDLYDDIDVNRTIKAGKIDALKTYYTANPQRINSLDKEGYPPLILAVSAGNIKMVEFLLSKGADINGRDKNGGTALHKAVNRNNLEIVKLLLKRNADINARDNKGWTPLHCTPAKASPDIVKALLEKNPDVNAQDNNGWTPLHVAIAKNRQDVAFLLHSMGHANLKIKNKQGVTPLNMARLRGRSMRLKEIQENIKNAPPSTEIKHDPLNVSPDEIPLIMPTITPTNPGTVPGKGVPPVPGKPVTSPVATPATSAAVSPAPASPAPSPAVAPPASPQVQVSPAAP